MREIRTSGSTSGMWKRGTWLRQVQRGRQAEGILRHRQTKGAETDRPLLNYRATSRLYAFSLKQKANRKTRKLENPHVDVRSTRSESATLCAYISDTISPLELENHVKGEEAVKDV